MPAEEQTNDGGSVEPTVEADTSPTATQPTETDMDLMSRYGDVMPDVIEELMPAVEDDPLAASTEGEEETPPQPNDGTAPSADGGKVEGKETSPPTTEPVTTTTQPAEGGNVDLIAAQAQITQLTNLLSSQGTTQAQATLSQPAEQGDTLDAVPEYNFEIPDQLINMIGSEDPAERKQALGALMTGLSQTVHQQVAGLIREVRDSVPATLQQHTQTNQLQSQVNTDFYGKYAQLNTPQLRPVVQNVAKTIMANMQAQGIPVAWTPEFMDQVGTQAMAILAQATGGANAPPVPANPPTNPPATFGGNSGGGANVASKLGKGRTTQQNYMEGM